MTRPARYGHDLTWNRHNLAALMLLCVLAGCAVLLCGLRRPVTLDHEISIDPQKVAAATERIDPNDATVASLRRLPGIGPTMAKRIVNYRMTHGRGCFGKPEDLTKVHRIGEITVRRIRPHLSLSHGLD